jgi:hypothetical protein
MTRLAICVLCATLLLPLARPAAADDSAPAKASNGGGYLGSRLVPAESQAACPPGIDLMYQAYEIVTGTDMRQRPWGFAQTLREVLVKTSGDARLTDDPRATELAVQAARFVACFTYADMMAETPLHDDQGTYDRPYRLTVTFGPAKIDALLVTLGDRPSRGERPVVMPMRLVHGPKPPPYRLSAEAPRGPEQRGAFAVAAGQFGMKFRIPSAAELAKWGASVEHLPRPPLPSTPKEAIVVGTLDWSETLPGWIGTWGMRWNNVDHEWGVRGVNYDASFRDIIGGAELIASGNGSPDRAAR